MNVEQIAGGRFWPCSLLVPVLVVACGGVSPETGPGDGSGKPVARTVTVRLGHDGGGTVTSATGGIACGPTCTASVTDGTVMVLTAMPGDGSSFAGWSGPCTDTSATCTFTVKADVTVGAAFDRRRHTIAVVTAGNGAGTVSSTPGGLSCPGACSMTVVDGTQVTLAAVAQSGSVFLGWTGAGCTGTGSCVVTASADVNVTASFGPQHSLVVTVTGSGTGTVTSSPSGISCGTDCAEIYPPGTSVTLTASAAAGSRFAGWTGGGCTGTGTCVVTLNDAMMVEARFDRLMRSLTVNRTGLGAGTVSSLVGIACGATCTATVADGTLVVLTATPESGSLFAGWSGPCTGTNQICSFTINSDVTAGAQFDRRRHPVTVAITGNGAGTVTSTPGGLACPGTCSLTVDEGTQVTLTATPGAGSVFLGWSGGGCAGTGSCVMTVNSDLNVNASFALNRSLVVTKTGSGTGTVTSSPNGIACGPTCTASFPQGTAVTLTAAAATESRFAGWGGSCSGTGSCAVTVNAAMMVEAQFEHTCGGVGQACCTIGPVCDSGSGCLNNMCTTCPGPPQTTVLVNLPDEQDGSNCFGVNNTHTYGGACAPGTHHEQCQVLANNPPPNSFCQVSNFGVGGPSDCVCRVLFHTSANCNDRIHCSVTITQTTNPPPHPVGCP